MKLIHESSKNFNFSKKLENFNETTDFQKLKEFQTPQNDETISE